MIGKKEKKRSKWFFWVVLLMVAASVGLLVHFWPLLKTFASFEQREAVVAQIRAQGPLGVFILLGIQFLQIVVAVIPAGIAQTISGALYGVVGGAIVCMLGTILPTSFVFFLVRRFGVQAVEKMIPIEQINRFSFLKDPKKLDITVFLLFLVPGSPKDVLTYLVPMTGMKLRRFLLLTSIARIPSTLLGTLIGATMAKGAWWQITLIFALTLGVGGGGIFLQDRLRRGRGNRDQ